MASTMSSMQSQPVVFKTQTQYPLPSQKFMIPTSWKRYQLSQLINKALSLEKPVPFDFLVKGELLHTTLAQWSSENGVGEEETLEIEYIESILPPQKMSDFPHDDWVSAVSCQIPGHFITASYDGQLRAFDYSKNLKSTTMAHTAAITSLCIVSSDSDSYTVASSSQDLTAQITQIHLDASTPSKVLASLHLHTVVVSSIASNAAGTNLLTSSWDGLIGFWDTSIPEADEVPEPVLNERDRKKRRRIENATSTSRKAPLLVLKSHIGRVSRALFAQGQGKAVSCGFDSTVRMWNTEYGVCENTISSADKPFLDLVLTPDGNSALAVSTDRTMSLFDLRSSSTNLASSIATFTHPATPSCVTVAEDNSHQVMTGAYDGVVRVWDVRSVKGAVATFKAFEGGKKVLSVDWRRGIVGVGGEGGLEVWKVGEEKA